MDTRKSPIHNAFALTLPLLMGYVPFGAVFGLLFTHLGFSWIYAPIMSFFVYAGAVQVVALGVLAKHGSYWMLILATIFLAMRNSFYGISLLDRYAVKNKLKKMYLIFSLVDSTYGILTTTPVYPDKQRDEQFCIWVSMLTHVYWVLGTLIGAYGARWMPDLPGLQFALTALFVVLAVEQYLAKRKLEPFMIASIASLIAAVAMPSQLFLVAIFISLVVIIFIAKKEQKRDGAR